MANSTKFVISITLFTVLLPVCSCSVFVAHERTYSLSSTEQVTDNSIDQIIQIVENHMKSKGMILSEMYHESMPGDWWVLKFKIPENNNPLSDLCERPSVCLNRLGENHFQISYRIVCLEDFFGNSKVPDDIDLWSGFKDSTISMETQGGTIFIDFIKANQGITGECRVW